MTVRIAILGAGIMGADHARIVSGDLPGAVLQVVCDAAESRARLVAEECGAADVATDPLAVIARPDVDAVLIASPDETHAPLTLAAIEAGKPVLCEKPLAPGSDECLKVIEAETKAGRQLVHLGFMRRFDPSYTEMKAALSDGTLGRAVMMHNFHRNVQAPANFTGQMAITNSAPHEFDVARFVLDTDYASISVFQPAGVDASRTGAPVFIVLETTGGQLVNIEINNTMPPMAMMCEASSSGKTVRSRSARRSTAGWTPRSSQSSATRPIGARASLRPTAVRTRPGSGPSRPASRRGSPPMLGTAIAPRSSPKPAFVRWRKHAGFPSLLQRSRASTPTEGLAA